MFVVERVPFYILELPKFVAFCRPTLSFSVTSQERSYIELRLTYTERHWEENSIASILLFPELNASIEKVFRIIWL